ncbi:MAG: hypothetical protein GF344_05085 [Chitinivibrionales bacterium]|nr:hypothetical protein [Chitinivibrionales bacterium]MBD3356373.1 hypothetical protein [Chitinivibrionales bacterium]
MRLTHTIVFAVLVSVTLVTAQNAKFVQPTKNNVGVYKEEIRKPFAEAMVTVGVDDRLQVLEQGRNHYQVQTPGGKIGWVEKRLVAATSGRQFQFEDAEVIGYLDNPTPVYIIDANAQDATPIKLDRSFADALRENVDRESIERQSK